MGISTHVLDTGLGRPAAGVMITLERRSGEAWERIGRGSTDADGRCASLMPDDPVTQMGTYRMRFETAAYFKAKDARCLYPYVDIVFEVSEDRHHHIPLLLTANGYTTYRGS